MFVEDRYRRAAAASGIGMWDWNLVTGNIFVDPVLKERLGYQEQDFRDNFEAWVQLTHPEDASRVLELARSHIQGITPLYEAEYRMRHRDGSYRWFHTRGSAIRDEHGVAIGMAGSTIDVTDRYQKEAFRAGQHQVLEMIASGTPIAAVLDSLVRLVESQSEGMLCTVLLLDQDGKTIRHGAAPSLPPEYMRAIDGQTIGPQAGSCGTAMYRAERVIVTDILSDPLWEGHRDVASRFGVRACWSTPIFSPQRQVLGSLAMYYAEPRAPRDEELWLIETAADIARIALEQHRTHAALRHSEARNQAMLRAIPDWVFLMSADGVYLDFHAKDPSALYAPPSTFLGRNYRDVLPPEIVAPVTLAMARLKASDETEQIEYSLGTDEDRRFYEASLTRCDGDKILSIVRDITARKRAQLEADAHRRELAHLSRVAMLGELTGTLAHELSQPLAAVLSNAQAARRFLDRQPLDVDKLRATLDDIIGNDRRAGAVIDRLRALLRKGGAVAQQHVDVSDLVLEVLALTSGELMSRRVIVSSTLPSGMPLVLGDRVQLQQVVLNLVLNACDAMNRTGPNDRHLQLLTGAHDDMVEIVVSDRGPGIPDGELERVFEPFVTLREEGLGLGLAISRSIISAHGGSIRAEHNAGGGATFRCRLPIAIAAPLTQAG